MNTTCIVKPGWNFTSIALMIVGFIVAWPLGLLMLAYILWGDQMKLWWREKGPQMRQAVERPASFFQGAPQTGNSAFDAYRARELQRLEEERAKLDALRADFDAFLRHLRQAKDQEEFDRFMTERTKAAPSA